MKNVAQVEGTYLGKLGNQIGARYRNQMVKYWMKKCKDNQWRAAKLEQVQSTKLLLFLTSTTSQGVPNTTLNFTNLLE